MAAKKWAFEDFAEGVSVDLGSKDVTAEEIVEFASEFDPQPMHLDEAAGRVPWWQWQGDGAGVSLHQILVHVVAETHRHAGHADIVRELVDGATGLRADNSNLPPGDQAWWESYRNKLEAAAKDAAGA